MMMTELAQTPKRAPPSLVLYDGTCGVCQAFALWLMRSDRAAQLSLIAYQHADLRRLTPGLTREELRQAMHFIDAHGQCHRGARAVFEALKRMPGIWGRIGTLLATPFLSTLAEPLYRLFAKHRTTVSKLLRLQVCRPAPSVLRGTRPQRHD